MVDAAHEMLGARLFRSVDRGCPSSGGAAVSGALGRGGSADGGELGDGVEHLLWRFELWAPPRAGPGRFWWAPDQPRCGRIRGRPAGLDGRTSRQHRSARPAAPPVRGMSDDWSCVYLVVAGAPRLRDASLDRPFHPRSTMGHPIDGEARGGRRRSRSRAVLDQTAHRSISRFPLALVPPSPCNRSPRR